MAVDTPVSSECRLEFVVWGLVNMFNTLLQHVTLSSLVYEWAVDSAVGSTTCQ
jgi:hypothetical protein